MVCPSSLLRLGDRHIYSRPTLGLKHFIRISRSYAHDIDRHVQTKLVHPQGSDDPQLGPLQRKIHEILSRDLQVQDLKWRLSPRVSVKLLKRRVFNLTYNHSNYPEQSQLAGPSPLL